MLAYYVCNFLIIGSFARGHLPVQQPNFKSLPLTIKSEENDTIFLPCVVDNLGGSYIRWWKDKALLSEYTTATVTTLPKFTVMSDGITIAFLKPEDSGEYTCEVVRPEPWSSLKQTHKLQVMYPPQISSIPSDGYLETTLGERVYMGCSATGVPTPIISLRKKGVAMDLTGENKQELEFTATSRMMSGTYQCEANNGIGDPVHTNIFLRILHKPEVNAEKSWIHSAPGIKTALVCRVVADPVAKVEWFFNEETLKMSGPRIIYQVRGDDHILLFKSIMISDFGNYTCRAENTLGTSQDHMQLSGIANPVIFKKVEGKLPNGFTLIWEVDSYSPVFEYKLLFREQDSQKQEDGQWVSFIIPADGFPSGPLHSKLYTLSGLDKFAVYEAKVLSRNRFGWSKPSEIITFGLMKSRYEEGEDTSEKVFNASELAAPRLIMLLNGLLLVLLSFKFFLSIYDIS